MLGSDYFAAENSIGWIHRRIETPRNKRMAHKKQARFVMRTPPFDPAKFKR